MRRYTLVTLFLALAPVTAGGQGRIIPRPCDMPPSPRPVCHDGRCSDVVPRRCPEGNPIVRTSSVVRADIVGRVIRYEVSETFLNQGSRIGEADYVFPLPKGAAFEDLKLSINGELVSGETMPAEKARQIYEDIVRRLRDPALVEWMGTGMLRTRIFPIAAGEEKRVVVRFQSLLEREGNALRVDYVRGSDPRGTLIPGEPRVLMEGASTDHERNASDHLRESGSAFTLIYERTRDYGEPYSPTHNLRVRDRADRRVVSTTGEGREVTILLPLRRPNETSVTVLAHRPDREDGFALIAITPPSAPSRTTPRDVSFVVDVSGSMRGEKLAQAKAAGRRLLESLGPNDRFRVIDFSTDVRTFRDDWTPATSANVRAALRYLNDLRADGSTNISGALDETLAVPAGDDRLPLVVFLTDGEPTVGERNPDAIAAMAARQRGEARIFTIGVSADINAVLIEQLAVQGRGTAHFVRAGESAERTVSLLATRLQSPVVTNLRVRADGVTLRELQPAGPVDLYAGQDLILLARYDGSGTARIRLEGDGPRGHLSWSTEARFPERERQNPFVARLWAAQRIGWLAAEKRRNGGTHELDAEIRSLGERYGIPTEFSSYLVVEPGMQVAGGPVVMQESRRRSAQPASPLPSVASNATGAGAPQRRDEAVAGGAADMASPSQRQFEAARKAAMQREARSLSALDSATAGERAGGNTRMVGTRTFVRRDSAWVDTRYTQAMSTIRIKPFSPAYFDLVQRLPGLGDILALGERVTVAGKTVAITVVPDGVDRLTESQLADIARGW